MANSVSQSFVDQFESYVHHLAQQSEYRLRDKVRSETGTGKTYNFERLGATDALQKVTQFAPTPVIDVPHSRRVAVLADYDWGAMVDEQDMIRTLTNPKSEYARNAAMAMTRQWDQLIVDAALGDTIDGDGATITWATEGAGQIVDLSAGMLTVAGILEAKRIMDAAEVPEADRCMVISAKEMTDLMMATEATSVDFVPTRNLVNGTIGHFSGFELIRSELLDVNTDVRSCFAFQRQCIGMYTGMNDQTRIDERRDLSYAWQVYRRFSATATRIEAAGVVEVKTKATPA